VCPRRRHHHHQVRKVQGPHPSFEMVAKSQLDSYCDCHPLRHCNLRWSQNDGGEPRKEEQENKYPIVLEHQLKRTQTHFVSLESIPSRFISEARILAVAQRLGGMESFLVRVLLDGCYPYSSSCVS
jgi:hypothetical protein